MVRVVLPPTGPSGGVAELGVQSIFRWSRHGKPAKDKMGEGFCPCLDINRGLTPHNRPTTDRGLGNPILCEERFPELDQLLDEVFGSLPPSPTLDP
jgi:hypothetical protein